MECWGCLFDAGLGLNQWRLLLLLTPIMLKQCFCRFVFFLAVNDYRNIERQQNSIVENKNKRAKTKAKTVCQSQQHRVNPQNCQLYFN